MTVTWTSGYHFDEAIPVVVWGPTTMRTKERTHAITVSFRREDTCGNLHYIYISPLHNCILGIQRHLIAC